MPNEWFSSSSGGVGRRTAGERNDLELLRRCPGPTIGFVKKGTTGEAHVWVDAPPEAVYGVVSDVTRMGEWSPETVACRWLDGATGPAVGARFKGTNKRGLARWSTKPVVVAADPGRAFVFDVGPDIRWTYRFEVDGTGTKLSESFEMLRDIRWYYALAERWLMRVEDRKADLERAMSETIGRIKRAAESESST
jgi:hypothetical protein